MGSDTNGEACNTQHCPVNGGWGLWSEWSSCSETCGIGARMRTRMCNTPYPRIGGTSCPGEARETGSCMGMLCKKLPEVAHGTLMGELNGEDLGIVNLMANVPR
ncbi:Hemicentin-1 [Chionoecetes opilio]|uniref:Hemicentin-1 n=1 Tax=Chionoecetes opilio TaxID=41210 RepID=A0A8J5CQ89_CHIOP|nr:Hemicentin-1 [Chionoecetes opilio]